MCRDARVSCRPFPRGIYRLANQIGKADLGGSAHVGLDHVTEGRGPPDINGFTAQGDGAGTQDLRRVAIGVVTATAGHFQSAVETIRPEPERDNQRRDIGIDMDPVVLAQVAVASTPSILPGLRRPAAFQRMAPTWPYSLSAGMAATASSAN